MHSEYNYHHNSSATLVFVFTQDKSHLSVKWYR